MYPIRFTKDFDNSRSWYIHQIVSQSHDDIKAWIKAWIKQMVSQSHDDIKAWINNTPDFKWWFSDYHVKLIIDELKDRYNIDAIGVRF